MLLRISRIILCGIIVIVGGFWFSQCVFDYLHWFTPGESAGLRMASAIIGGGVIIGVGFIIAGFED